jgi:Fe-Mn family superoxide dismutase
MLNNEKMALLKLKAAIDKQFGSLEEMKKKFSDASLARFGSGWTWLGVKADGTLAITTTPNQGEL